LAAYISSVISLKECTTALEKHVLADATSHKLDTEESEDDFLHAESSHLDGDQVATVSDGVSDLQDLQRRIKAIEKAMVEKERHFSANQEGKKFGDGVGNTMKKREISGSENEILTKDIILDQISKCSSYGISRRDTIEVDGQMLELWETTDQDASIDLMKSPGAGSLKTLPSPVFEEFHVQEGSKRRILERLDSDVQTWTNLQITVEDLKRKVEITEKSKKGKGIEFENVKGQLEEADEAITKLFDVNQKLMKNVEDAPLFSDGASGVVSDESGGVRRRRLSEQAKRGSENIRRLQLEVQKLQFLLLKLDGEKESRGSTRITERKTRVLLRDYIYGGNRTNQKRKKAPFCACIQVGTKGD
ncbi:unnamed protein product, partial [Prunus brigantina]